MAEKREDLIVVHLDIDALHGAEATGENFLQVLDPQIVILRLQALAADGRSLVVTSWHLCRFKIVAFNILLCDETLVDASAIGSLIAATAPRPTAAPVVAGGAEEARVEPLAEV